MTDGAPWRVAALYHFADLPDHAHMRGPLREACEELGLCGTLLLAPEGINGTVAGTGDRVDQLIAGLRADPRLRALDAKFSTSTRKPFHRMKVRLKREIVTLGVEGVDPTERVGTYVEPRDWNALISDPDVAVIDTRNAFEVELGSFRGAIDPKTESFREFPDWVRAHRGALEAGGRPKRVAMFCTGGIRCEKASSWMLDNGFEEVYHLKGGILRYLEELPEEDSLWQGECFVFDERVSVGHGLAETDTEVCRSCRMPLSVDDRSHPLFEAGVSCHRCAHEMGDARRKRLRERQMQVDLASQRGELHIGRKA